MVTNYPNYLSVPDEEDFKFSDDFNMKFFSMLSEATNKRIKELEEQVINHNKVIMELNGKLDDTIKVLDKLLGTVFSMLGTEEGNRLKSEIFAMLVVKKPDDTEVVEKPKTVKRKLRPE